MLKTLKDRNKRICIFLWHLLFSVVIALCTAALVFWLWFPYPYNQMTRGVDLFLLIIVVDVVCGPLITLILANPKKSKKELILDLALVSCIQLGALFYGLYILSQARPVLVSFERDRFALIINSEIDWSDTGSVSKELQNRPLFGVTKVGIRRAKNEKEFFESVQLGMQGVEPSVRPSWWLPYAEVIPEIKQKMYRVDEIDMKKLDAKSADKLNKSISKTGVDKINLFYLPFVSHKEKGWIVLMDNETNFLGYVNIDGFDLK